MSAGASGGPRHHVRKCPLVPQPAWCPAQPRRGIGRTLRLRTPCAPRISTPSMSAVADGPGHQAPRSAPSRKPGADRRGAGCRRSSAGSSSDHEVLRQEAERVDAELAPRSARPSRSRRRRRRRARRRHRRPRARRRRARREAAACPRPPARCRADDACIREELARSADPGRCPADARRIARPCARGCGGSARPRVGRPSSKLGTSGSAHGGRLVAREPRSRILSRLLIIGRPGSSGTTARKVDCRRRRHLALPAPGVERVVDR